MRVNDSPNGTLFLMPETTEDIDLIAYLEINEFLDQPKLSKLTGQPYAVKRKDIRKVLPLLQQVNAKHPRGIKLH